MAIAILAILAGIVIAATGRGGEMARFPNDYAPPEFGALAATDVALLRPPTALWGYNMQVTDEALNGIASALSARDVRIASLERQLSELRAALANAAWAGGGQAGAPGPAPAAPATPGAGTSGPGLAAGGRAAPARIADAGVWAGWPAEMPAGHDAEPSGEPRPAAQPQPRRNSQAARQSPADEEESR